jgi:hypothetical protein
MAIKTQSDLREKSSKEKQPAEDSAKEKAKPLETVKEANKNTLFVPFAKPDAESSATIKFKTKENGKPVEKTAVIKIINQKYKINDKDCGGEKYLKDFLTKLTDEGFVSYPDRDPNLPTEWKIRHGDFVNGAKNNYTGVSKVDLPDGGHLEIHWKNGYVETKDEKIRDILVSKGHYDMTTNSLHIQKPDPLKSVKSSGKVEKGSYVTGPTSANVTDMGYYEPTKGTKVR